MQPIERDLVSGKDPIMAENMVRCLDTPVP